MATIATVQGLVGKRIGQVTVIRIGEREGADYRLPVLVRCDRGHESILIGKAVLRAAREGHSMRCRFCRPARARTCRLCGEAGHGARDCERNEQRGQKHCAVCEGLSHRRWKPKCPGCGEPYQPEPPVTVEDALQQAHDTGTVMWT